jgi:addiction module HigA family antidote
MTKMEEQRDYPPLSPGAVLQERIVSRLGISQAALAEALGVSRFTVNQVLRGRRGVTAEMALRLGHVLDTSPELWLKLQAQVDLFEARRAAGAEIAKLPRLRKTDAEERSAAAE